MSDIVERLRTRGGNYLHWAEEAADEIESLRADNDRLREALEVVSDILKFVDGSEEKLTPQGEPVVWINASSPDGDLQTMLKATRAALAKEPRS